MDRESYLTRVIGETQFTVIETCQVVAMPAPRCRGGVGETRANDDDFDLGVLDEDDDSARLEERMTPTMMMTTTATTMKPH